MITLISPACLGYGSWIIFYLISTLHFVLVVDTVCVEKKFLICIHMCDVRWAEERGSICAHVDGCWVGKDLDSIPSEEAAFMGKHILAACPCWVCGQGIISCMALASFSTFPWEREYEYVLLLYHCCCFDKGANIVLMHCCCLHIFFPSIFFVQSFCLLAAILLIDHRKWWTGDCVWMSNSVEMLKICVPVR